MGREFLEVFEGWAHTYDQTVTGNDVEYQEVFSRYDDILNDVVKKSGLTVLEFGVGTGNLTQKLLNENKKVYGVEPSEPMREIALEKLQNYSLTIEDGDFIVFNKPADKIDTIVSTYAFHHLNDGEKNQAFSEYSKILDKGGKIVFADTIFENKREYTMTIQSAIKKGYLNLAKDLETEYYTTIPNLQDIANQNGFTVEFTRFNHFVWVMEATKQ
ncbi:class I SAM-dependent methyltransferase [Bacillus sp. REN16]|uniref:class I SAM-dependent methyltransferase n=1 Tax=Bacillus sp. REN16 TaxID=2887296 RepID=UPI001E402EA7|nr:class I SAM-dependent methyltransferase [Bacillus sp. REN16]MCC3356627.1 class I SAM-dependent methyltransferase [Bacillus sp. REN16]